MRTSVRRPQAPLLTKAPEASVKRRPKAPVWNVQAHCGEDKFVVLEFTRAGCNGCRRSQPLFAERAARHAADGAFFEVQWEDAGNFVRACGVQAVPVSHIYSRGALVEALSANPSKWEALAASIDEVSSGLTQQNDAG